MIKTILILLITGIIIPGCIQKKHSQQPPQPTTNNSFFPVTEYLLGQIKDLDSLPITPLKITTINGTIDSVWIKREQLRSFIQPFINAKIDSASLHNYFAEHSFLDETIHAFTFTYDPIVTLPDTMVIRHWDVYINPDNNKVQRIYIVKTLNKNPSTQTIQLTWKSGYYCQITTITEQDGKAPQIKEEKIIWNFND